MIILGIDIGLTGALAALNTTNGTGLVYDMPVTGGDDNRVLGRDLIHMMRTLAPAVESCIVVAEDIRPRPMGNGGRHGNTMHSQGSLMRSRGAIEAVCDIVGFRVEWISPQAWKRHYGLIGKDKDASRQVALALFPDSAHDLARKKDHNRADSILLARYGAMKFA